jgi:hypothetical protein
MVLGRLVNVDLHHPAHPAGERTVLRPASLSLTGVARSLPTSVVSSPEKSHRHRSVDSAFARLFAVHAQVAVLPLPTPRGRASPRRFAAPPGRPAAARPTLTETSSDHQASAALTSAIELSASPRHTGPRGCRARPVAARLARRGDGGRSRAERSRCAWRRGTPGPAGGVMRV